MEIVNFTDSVRSLSAKYIDDTNIDIKSTKVRIEQDYSIYNADILSKANDVKTGGYSTLYLSSKKYGEDILQYKQVITNTEDILITNLVYGNSNKDQECYLYINTPTTILPDSKTTCEFLLESQIDKINNTFFEIEFLDTRYCRIYHKINYDIFYLKVNENLNVFFQNRDSKISGISAVDEFVFSYILDKDSDKFSLYKPISGYNYSLSVSGRKLALVRTASATFVPFNSNNTFFVQYNDRISNISPKINTSWVSYKDVNGLEINSNKSSFKNKNNYLASSQYSFLTGNDIELNILPLKNQLTKDGVSQRGDYLLNIPNKLYPQSNLRDYEKIHIGSNCENNADDISLTYTFYNTEFLFKPDEYNVFETPESIYPYKQININDTLFAINGALGGDSPHSADKIYTQSIKTNLPNTGMYLCTWLSGGNESTPGLWIDRYFNTSKISPIDALTATSFKLYDYTSDVEEALEARDISDAFFDIKSNLIIEPSREYIYQRLGNKYIDSFITHLNNSVIFDTLSTRTSRGGIDIPTERTEIYSFSNNYHYNFIDKPVGNFTFSFCLQTDWEQPFGYQLAGNFNNKGFGIFNDEAITPFIFIPYEDTLYIYNTDFVLINKVDLNGTIRHIVRINPIDDIFVITKGRPDATPSLSGDQSKTIIHKLRSNGTIFDADILAEIDDYINILNTETDIHFLLDDRGNVASYNILSETITTSTVSIPTEYGVDFGVNSIGLNRHNELVGFRGDKCIKYNNDQHVFLHRNTLLVKESDDHTTRTILLSTASQVYDFTVDLDENLYIIHNKFLTKFDNQRNLIYKTVFASEYTPTSIDIVREYTEGGINQYPIVLLSDNKKNLFLAKVDDTLGNTAITPIEDARGEFINHCSERHVSNYYNLTNYGLFLKSSQTSNSRLNFRVEIPNKYNNRENLRKNIAVDISTLSVGKHHFAYRFDGVAGNITLFVDGKKIENITFDPAEYALENTLYNAFTIGASTYFNGSIINDYLKQPDRYFCRNIVMEYPRLFSSAVDDIDIKFLGLQNRRIGELSVSLPCGERNQIEEIDRLFKWQLPGSKSNKINIRVKNSLLSNNQINSVLGEIIKREVQKVLPSSVNINNITFERY